MRFSGARCTGYQDDMWEFAASYKTLSDSDDAAADDGSQVSFDCSGGSAHIVRALSQRRILTEEQDPDPGDMIGWNGDPINPDYAGVDIVTSSTRETRIRKMRPSALTTDLKRTLVEHSGFEPLTLTLPV